MIPQDQIDTLFYSYLGRLPKKEEYAYIAACTKHMKHITIQTILYQILLSHEYFEQAFQQSTPFQIFRIPLEKQKAFHQISQYGMQEAKKKSIVFCGLIRDSQTMIPHIQAFFQRHQDQWTDIRFLIVENDSKDRTRPKLLQWANEDSRIEILGGPTVNAPFATLHLPPTPSHKPTDDSRIRKMAILRNMYVQRVREAYSHFDYMCVLDLDIQGNLYKDGFYHSIGLFERHPLVDAFAANGALFYSNIPEQSYQPSYTSFEMTYYDPFALVEKGKPYIYPNSQTKYMHDSLGVSYARRIQIGQPPMLVTSAFAGCCIYRIRSILPTHIQYSYSAGLYSCEHAHFNRHLKNMAINPSMKFLCLKH